jgi:Rhs element Vgr protein
MANSKNKDLVSIKVIIDGSPIDEVYDISDIQVSKAVNRIAIAHITLIDGSVADEDFSLSSSDNFVPGNKIEIQVGFGLKTKSIFQGIITAQNIRMVSHYGSKLHLECRDTAIKMAIGAKNRVFTDSTDNDALTKIIEDNGVTAEVSSTSSSFPQIVQYYSTDWDFTMARAEANGMIVLNMDNKVTIKAPTADGNALGKFTFGQEIVEMNLKLDASTQLETVEAQSWDYKTQANLQSSASAPSVVDQGNLSGSTLAKVAAPSSFQLQSTGPLTADELKTWADASLLKSRLAKVQGDVKLFGQADFVPDQILEFAGLGTRFNGSAYVSAVEHHISGGNWWSTLSIGLNPTWFAKANDITATAASALLPGIRGLQNAVVKQINNDPASEIRVQVEVPMLKSADGENLIWARWLQPYATSGAGQFFMPEIGDEVALGFLNEDPRYPVILGSLYSSQNAPPYQPAEENPIKAIVTKNQLKVAFDDQNKVITISTPGGNTIMLTDEDQGINIVDQNENKIMLSPSGISMQSPADIEIKADGQVSITGTAGVTVSSEAEASISAEATLNISGLEVSISAETSLSASGEAEASITAGGELSLTGAMIMIN